VTVRASLKVYNTHLLVIFDIGERKNHSLLSHKPSTG